jgi:hypothetical protein
VSSPTPRRRSESDVSSSRSRRRSESEVSSAIWRRRSESEVSSLSSRRRSESEVSPLTWRRRSESEVSLLSSEAPAKSRTSETSESRNYNLLTSFATRKGTRETHHCQETGSEKDNVGFHLRGLCLLSRIESTSPSAQIRFPILWSSS